MKIMNKIQRGGENEKKKTESDIVAGQMLRKDEYKMITRQVEMQKA